MIPVAAQPEPPRFRADVEIPGDRWLADRGLALEDPIPSGLEPPPHWRKCLPDLRKAYSEVCAYVSLWIPPITGGASVDHFVAKSGRAGLTYRWSNYRLACSLMNSRKREFEDVLDPFTLDPGTFRLNFADGAIGPDKSLSPTRASAAKATVERLALDSSECRTARLQWWDEYRAGTISSEFMKRRAPFVWTEAVRQNLIRA